MAKRKPRPYKADWDIDTVTTNTGRITKSLVRGMPRPRKRRSPKRMELTFAEANLVLEESADGEILESVPLLKASASQLADGFNGMSFRELSCLGFSPWEYEEETSDIDKDSFHQNMNRSEYLDEIEKEFTSLPAEGKREWLKSCCDCVAKL